MDRYGLVTTEVSGRLSPGQWLDSVLELGELTAWSNELWEIVIIDPRIDFEPDRRPTLELAHNAKEIIQFKTRGAIGVYAPTPRIRRWAEKVAALLRGDAVPIVVFMDEADTRKWLEVHMETSRLSATTRISRNREEWLQQ